MACDEPAPSAKATCFQGMKVEPRGETWGQPSGSPGTPKVAVGIQPSVKRGKKKEPKEENTEEGKDSSGSGDGTDKSLDEDSNSKDVGKNCEESVDDLKSFPPQEDVTHNAPQAAAGSATQTAAGGRTQYKCTQTTSQPVHSAGDFANPWELECQAMYMSTHRTSIARTFISLGLVNDIVDAIMNKQGYNTPHALSCLEKKGIEMLVSAVHKPGGIKSRTLNPNINIPLQS